MSDSWSSRLSDCLNLGNGQWATLHVGKWAMGHAALLDYLKLSQLKLTAQSCQFHEASRKRLKVKRHHFTITTTTTPITKRKSALEIRLFPSHARTVRIWVPNRERSRWRTWRNRFYKNGKKGVKSAIWTLYRVSKTLELNKCEGFHHLTLTTLLSSAPRSSQGLFWSGHCSGQRQNKSPTQAFKLTWLDLTWPT